MSKKLFDSVGADEAREDRHHAEVGGRYSDGNAYIGSYLDGARALTDRALTTGDGTRLIYSAIFLYRHAIELVLEELLFSTPRAG